MGCSKPFVVANCRFKSNMKIFWELTFIFRKDIKRRHAHAFSLAAAKKEEILLLCLIWRSVRDVANVGVFPYQIPPALSLLSHGFVLGFGGLIWPIKWYSWCIWTAKIAKIVTIEARKHFQCTQQSVPVTCETREVSHITATGYSYLPEWCMLLLHSSAAQRTGSPPCSGDQNAKA